MAKGIEDKSRANKPQRGRKSKTSEEKTTRIAIGAIEKKFGSLEAGMMALLDSREPALIRFVFEHAMGKPKEKIEKKIDHVHHLRIGYGDNRNEIEDSEENGIEDAEVIEPDIDLNQTIQLPGNAD